MRFSSNKLTVAMLAIAASFAASAAHAAISISTDPTQNMSCSGSTCTPTASDAVLNTGDLTAMLATGNVTVATTGFAEANDIRVTAPFSWASSAQLTFNALHAIVFASPVNVASNGGVSLTAATANGTASLFFISGASLSFASLKDALSINGSRYVLVDTVDKLAAAIIARPDRSFALSSDFDAKHTRPYSSPPIGIPFSGRFSGLGHTISNLRIGDAASPSVGLFATVLSNGSVSNIGVTKTAVFGANTVGGLVGLNQGSVSNAFVTGTVQSVLKSGYTYLGGLVGNNAGTVTNCWTDARVVNGSIVGGLVGQNGGVVDSAFAGGTVLGYNNAGGLIGANSASDARIIGSTSNSYATGYVKLLQGGPQAVGGLAGTNPGYQTDLSNITTSYSTGVVRGYKGSYKGGSMGWQHGTATDIYWDTTTSGVTQGVGDGDGSGVTGLTTTQLQSGLPAGFDPALWGQDPSINNGYPYLLANPPQ